MQKKCKLCAGTGQRCYFGGESRFLLTWGDCPECCGTGYELEGDEPDQETTRQTTRNEPPDTPPFSERPPRPTGDGFAPD
jgi:hypothetical protein